MSTASIRSEKRRIRLDVVGRILAMDPADRLDEQRELDRLFPTLPGLDDAGTVLLYVSHLPEEFETRRMIRGALDRGRTVACPRVDREARMLRLHRVEDLDRDLAPGPFGIPEPKAGAPEIAPDRIEWALVPGVAFDRLGYRIGRGAGFYDRLLPTFGADVPKLALVLDPQCVEAIPTEPHDVPVDGIIGAKRRWMPPAGRAINRPG